MGIFFGGRLGTLFCLYFVSGKGQNVPDRNKERYCCKCKFWEKILVLSNWEKCSMRCQIGNFCKKVMILFLVLFESYYLHLSFTIIISVDQHHYFLLFSQEKIPTESYKIKKYKKIKFIRYLKQGLHH